MRKNKVIGVVGAGDIGFEVSELLAVQGFDVKIYNRYHEVDGKPSPYWLTKMGRLKDITDGLQIPGFGEVELTSNLDDLNKCYAMIITAGAKRSNIHETREELAEKNALIMQNYVDFIIANPDCLVVVITNPVDTLAQYLIESASAKSGRDVSFFAKHVAGVSLVDSLRLKNLVREFLASKKIFVRPEDVSAIAIGEHGPSMVPLMSLVKVNGKSLTEFATTTEIEELRNQTILRGNDIIKLTGASSVAGPAYAAMNMIRSIYEQNNSLVPCSTFDGTRAIGNLVQFEGNQISRIVELDISTHEQTYYNKSQQALDVQYKSIMQRLQRS